MTRRIRKKEPQWKPPDLSVAQIIEWADAWFRRTGRWPHKNSGRIIGAPGEKWGNVHASLCRGGRGLTGRTTLARLLEKERGVPNRKNRPRLTQKQILAWADAHLQRTGSWPVQRSGTIPESPTETWLSVNARLFSGGRGLPGGDSLAALLTRKRGARKKRNLPRLTAKLLLGWADAHYQRSGRWPTHKSGPIVDAPGETWLAVDMALRQEIRGWRGSTSLFRFVRKHRNVAR